MPCWAGSRALVGRLAVGRRVQPGGCLAVAGVERLLIPHREWVLRRVLPQRHQGPDTAVVAAEELKASQGAGGGVTLPAFPFAMFLFSTWLARIRLNMKSRMVMIMPMQRYRMTLLGRR